jgi:hypothetical protein
MVGQAEAAGVVGAAAGLLVDHAVVTCEEAATLDVLDVPAGVGGRPASATGPAAVCPAAACVGMRRRCSATLAARQPPRTEPQAVCTPPPPPPLAGSAPQPAAKGGACAWAWHAGSRAGMWGSPASGGRQGATWVPSPGQLFAEGMSRRLLVPRHPHCQRDGDGAERQLVHGHLVRLDPRHFDRLGTCAHKPGWHQALAGTAGRPRPASHAPADARNAAGRAPWRMRGMCRGSHTC